MLTKISDAFGVFVVLLSAILFIIILLLIGPFITMLLFNFVAPIFNIRHINFLEAIAIYVLANLLTSGIYHATKTR